MYNGFPPSVQKPIHPWFIGEGIKFFGRNMLRHPLLSSAFFQGCFDRGLASFALQNLVEQFHGCLSVSQGAVAVFVWDVLGIAQGAQSIPGQARKRLACKSDRAKFGTLPCCAHGFKMPTDERVVEPYVVRHKDGICQEGLEFIGEIGKAGGILEHAVIDASQSLDAGRHMLEGLHQGTPSVQDVFAIAQHHSNFCDASGFLGPSSGFNVDNGEFHQAKMRGNSVTYMWSRPALLLRGMFVP